VFLRVSAAFRSVISVTRSRSGEASASFEIDYGPGYRIYFARCGGALVLLLTAGDKSRQRADIAKARELAATWKVE
jgi:putative addiction module killer protein